MSSMWDETGRNDFLRVVRRSDEKGLVRVRRFSGISIKRRTQSAEMQIGSSES